MQYMILAAAFAAISRASPIADPVQNIEARTAGAQLATVSSLSTLPQSTPQLTLRTKFDELPNNSAIPVPYKGLNYTTLKVSDDNNGGLTSAQSKPYFAILSAQEFPYVTIQGTPTKSFNLESFYFGCFDSRSLGATSCEFTVTGFFGTTSRSRYGPILYNYQPANYGSPSPMMKIDTAGWNGLLYFYITVLGDATNKMRTYATIDNVKYTTVE